MTAISCENLTKKHKDSFILHDVTLDIDDGICFGMYGEVGAGKTTFLKILSGMITPTSGSCYLFDKDLNKDQATVLQDVGCLVGEPAFYEYLTAEENLAYFGSLLHEDSGPVMESLNITFGETYPSHMTLSMQYHLGIALALLGSPRLLVLDEPFSFLTEPERSAIISLLQDRVKEGMTLLFTTSHEEEMRTISSQGAILLQGKIQAHGPSSQLDFSDLEEVEA
jgi:ABC-2 type transport system ATP-binding protein